MCTHIVMKGFGFARMITSVPPLWSCTVQVPKYTATTRGGGVSTQDGTAAWPATATNKCARAYTACVLWLYWSQAGWLALIPAHLITTIHHHQLQHINPNMTLYLILSTQSLHIIQCMQLFPAYKDNHISSVH